MTSHPTSDTPAPHDRSRAEPAGDRAAPRRPPGGPAGRCVGARPAARAGPAGSRRVDAVCRVRRLHLALRAQPLPGRARRDAGRRRRLPHPGGDPRRARGPAHRTRAGSSCPWEPSSQRPARSPRTPTAGTRRARSSSSSASLSAPWCPPRRRRSRSRPESRPPSALFSMARRPGRAAARAGVVGTPGAAPCRDSSDALASPGAATHLVRYVVALLGRGRGRHRPGLAAPVLGHGRGGGRPVGPRPAVPAAPAACTASCGTLLGLAVAAVILLWGPQGVVAVLVIVVLQVLTELVRRAATTPSRCSSSPRWPCSMGQPFARLAHRARSARPPARDRARRPRRGRRRCCSSPTAPG